MDRRIHLGDVGVLVAQVGVAQQRRAEALVKLALARARQRLGDAVGAQRFVGVRGVPQLREIQREPLPVRTQSRATNGDGAYSTMRGGVKMGSGPRWRTRWKVCPCSEKRRWHR